MARWERGKANYGHFLRGYKQAYGGMEMSKHERDQTHINEKQDQLIPFGTYLSEEAPSYCDSMTSDVAFNMIDQDTGKYQEQKEGIISNINEKKVQCCSVLWSEYRRLRNNTYTIRITAMWLNEYLKNHTKNQDVFIGFCQLINGGEFIYKHTT